MSVNNLTKKEFDGINTDDPLTLRQTTALIAVAADDNNFANRSAVNSRQTVRQLLDLDDTRSVRPRCVPPIPGDEQ